MDFVYFAFLLITSVLVQQIEVKGCTNSEYCHTSNIKYRSYTAMNNSYLNNSYLIARKLIAKQINCLRNCTTTKNCHSINYYLQSNQMICDLLRLTVWPNASQILPKSNSTYIYVNNPCTSNPCQNDARCYINYNSGTYNCSCISNNLLRTSGRHCEVRKAFENASSVYYNFDTPPPFIDLQNKSLYNMSMNKNGKVLMVPDRSSPVIFAGNSPHGVSFHSNYYMNDCMLNPCLCTNGITVSLWFKIHEVSLLKSADQDACKQSHVYVVTTTNKIDMMQGFLVKFEKCKQHTFSVYVRCKTTFYRVSWGSNHDATFYHKWAHLLFTFKNGIVVYINGKHVTQSTVASATSAVSEFSNTYRLGFRGSNFEIFLDDFAVWRAKLNSSEVQILYERGLKA